MKSMFPRICIILCTCFFNGPSTVAQHFITKEGEFMDTSATGIDMRGLPYYYSVGGKYPRASATLLNDFKAFTGKKRYPGSGYITFRFVIDTTGNMLKKVQVIQTDEYYKDHYFDKALVDELFAYLKTLHEWKTPVLPNGARLPYRAVMTFKIDNGKVINIIP